MADKNIPDSVGLVPATKEADIVAGYAGYMGEPDTHDAAPITAPMLRWRHMGASSGDRIGGKYYNSLEGVDKAYDEIEAVFINGKNSRAYYAEKFDARRIKTEGASRPDCKSDDAVYGQGLYGVDAHNPENPSGLCETCPMSKWSGPGRDATPPPCGLSYDRLIYDFETHQVGIISFGGSKVRAVRDFQRAMQARNGGTVPMWGYKVKLSSEPRDNFHVPKIEILGVMPPEEAIKFKALKDESDRAFLRANTSAQMAGTDEDEPSSPADATAEAGAY